MLIDDVVSNLMICFWGGRVRARFLPFIQWKCFGRRVWELCCCLLYQ